MVQITVHVRPRNGYTSPGCIKTIRVDTSTRLEKLVADLKLDTKKGIALYSHEGSHELSLNTSLASNGVKEGDVLETCACPKLSAILSVALREMEHVQKLSQKDRIQGCLEPLLGPVVPWQPDKWDDENVKARIICMALMKKLIQRQDRFARINVPQCTNLMELYQFLRTTDTFADKHPGSRRHHNSMAHLFKPTTNRDGRPSTVWQLLQNKLNKLQQFFSRNSGSVPRSTNASISCPIDEFLASEKQRLDNICGVSTPSSASSRRKATPSNFSQARPHRLISIDSPVFRLHDQEWKCSMCKTAQAACMCLIEDCPFFKHLSCFVCFSANHPILYRNHERSEFSEPRVKAVLKSLHQQGKQDLYCPQYASGPFAILCTLYDQVRKGQHSLKESRLKELAQMICRSNLYDHQAQGRNAFACMEGLLDKKLVRKEHVLRNDQEGIYSLLPAGEVLAEYCYTFQKQVEATIQRASPSQTGVPSRRANPIALIMDTREDREYTKRLVRRCEFEHVSCEPRDLPAGDYIFLADGKVCPIVIERKSWSDLADSVLGKGRQQQRLDCVGIGRNNEACENGRCQLCKMKTSGCLKVMFLIEGARCVNREEAPNRCTAEKRCQFCREIQQRHGRDIVQDTLETVLLKLQVEHGCLVHYTRSYNETIDALLSLRDILGSERSGTEWTLTYEQFCTNARRKGSADSHRPSRPSVVEWSDTRVIKSIFSGSIEESIKSLAARSSLVIDLNDSFNSAAEASDICSIGFETGSPVHVSKKQRTGVSTSKEIVILDSDDESSCLVEIRDPPRKKSSTNRSSSSDDEVEVIDSLSVKPAARIVETRTVSTTTRHTWQKKLTPTLLLVNGLYQYDTEFYKDLTAVWTGLYQNHRCSNDASGNGFESLCASNLRQYEESPLVDRTAILFWLLKLQLKGVQVQVTRESTKIKKQLGTVFRLPLVDAPLQTTSPMRRKPMSIRKDPPTSSECIVLDSPLGAGPIEPVRNRKRHPSLSAHNRPPIIPVETERERLRRARLARFDNPKSGSGSIAKAAVRRLVMSDGHGWTCTNCTLQNEAEAQQCELCDTPKQGKEWQCSKCTLLNAAARTLCAACGTTIGGGSGSFMESDWSTPDQSNIGVARARAVHSGTASVRIGGTPNRRVKCGACGEHGHNRASATQYNCSKYNDSVEVDRRRKMREKKEKEAREARESIAQHQRENADLASKLEEMRRAAAAFEAAAASNETIRTNEIKRLERQRKRAEKQAKKYH